MFPVSISPVSSSKFKANKNGVMPVILQPIQGGLPPESGILDGTLADRLGLKAGFRYVLNITQAGTYAGRDGKNHPNYSYTVVASLGQDFDQLVATKLVGAMTFNFAPAVSNLTVAAPTVEAAEPVEAIEA